MNAPEIKRTSLADAFKGSGAEDAADLTGLLKPRRAAVVDKPVTAPPAPKLAAAEELMPSSAPSAALIEPADKTPVRFASDSKVENVPAYIDPVVLQAVRAARRDGVPAGDPEKTYDELLVDALERVPLDKIRAVFSPDDESTEGGLLQRRKRRSRGGGGTQIQLRMSKAQEKELAALTEVVGAPSRSAFVTAVYRLAYVNE